MPFVRHLPPDSMAASLDETMRAINGACRSKGGVYAQYSCKEVSWDDARRGTVGGQLSCWGSNITDTYLKAKDGTRLFTVRPDNWNEKLGKVSAEDVAVIVGNATPGGRCGPSAFNPYCPCLPAFSGNHNDSDCAGLRFSRSPSPPS